jgi:hypothetical protein
MISTFFRDMPVMDEVTSSTGDDAIVHVDADSRPFKYLLDIVTGEPVLTGENHVTFSDVEELLEVGNRLGFTQLPKLILPIMHHFTARQAWDVFVFAAKNDFLPLAIYAIGRFGADPKVRRAGIDNINHDAFDNIPGKYTVPLIRNMTVFRMRNGTADWDKVAYNFPNNRIDPEVSRAKRARADV